MLEKTESYSRVELLESGHVQLRKTTKITEDGVILSESHHRSVVDPNSNIDHLPADVKATIEAFWTNGGHYDTFPKPAVEAPVEEQVAEESVAEDVVTEDVVETPAEEAPAEESTETTEEV